MKMTEYKTTVLSLSQMMVDRLIEQLLSLDELSGTVPYLSPLSIIITNTCSTCTGSLSCFYYGTWGKNFVIALIFNFLQILIDQILHDISQLY